MSKCAVKFMLTQRYSLSIDLPNACIAFPNVVHVFLCNMFIFNQFCWPLLVSPLLFICL